VVVEVVEKLGKNDQKSPDKKPTISIETDAAPPVHFVPESALA
jgi:hypothetical protein